MAVNSSSFHVYHWFEPTTRFYIIASFLVAKLLLVLPPSLLILYVGSQKWQQQRSFATTSHYDNFTNHSAGMELIFVLGTASYFCGQYCDLSEAMIVGYYLCTAVIPGEATFHVLTCVDRYLAVVHPVTYLRLRQSAGVRIRNISVGCVWLLCVGWIGFTALYYPDPPHIPYLCFMILSLVVVSFCSLSVLHVLIRPGPGETGGNRTRVDQTKQRAFYTITAIMGVLWLFFLGYLVSLALDKSQALSYIDGQLVLVSSNFIALPISLVLPLLLEQENCRVSPMSKDDNLL